MQKDERDLQHSSIGYTISKETQELKIPLTLHTSLRLTDQAPQLMV